MTKKTILFSIPNFTTAGSGREMFNIIERLDKDYFHIIISVETKGGVLLDEIKEKGYEIIIGNHTINLASNNFIKMFYAFKLGLIYRKYKIDIWQSFHWSSNYFEPIIAMTAGAKYVYVKKNMNWNRAWWLKSILSDQIIARNTTLLSTYFNTFYFKKKTNFISGAVDLNKFNKKESSFKYRNEYCLNNDIRIITCIAQILPIKNQLLLVKAVVGIDNVILLLAGNERNAEYTSEIKRFIQSNALENKIFLLGNVSDTVDLLNQSDIFVLPTNKLFGHEEGCPVALLEAMACGVTCIASNVAGSIDLINDGINGYIFENDKIQSLSTKILEAINKPITIQKHMYQFDLSLEAEKFQSLYTKII
jgi:glycosyltransferase involved in cell wall biosynthesis